MTESEMKDKISRLDEICSLKKEIIKYEYLIEDIKRRIFKLEIPDHVPCILCGSLAGQEARREKRICVTCWNKRKL